MRPARKLCSQFATYSETRFAVPDQFGNKKGLFFPKGSGTAGDRCKSRSLLVSRKAASHTSRPASSSESRPAKREHSGNPDELCRSRERLWVPVRGAECHRRRVPARGSFLRQPARMIPICSRSRGLGGWRLAESQWRLRPIGHPSWYNGRPWPTARKPRSLGRASWKGG